MKVREQGPAHKRMGAAGQIGGIRDEGNDAVFGGFADAFLGKTEKANIEIVKKLFANTKLDIQHALAALLLLRLPEFVAAYQLRFRIDVIDQFNTLVMGNKPPFLRLSRAS
jgi:hypothetical protein